MTAAPAPPPADAITITHRRVSAGGVDWHLRQAGDGPPLLLLHGTGASGHSWEGLTAQLATRYAVWAPDLPGQGDSGPAGSGGPGLVGMSAALQALLAALQLSPVLLIGHSAGAALAARWRLDSGRRELPLLSINGAFVPWRGLAGRAFVPAARLLARQRWLPQFVSRSAGDTASVARLVANTGSRLSPEGIAAYAALMRRPAHVAGTLAMMAAWDLASLWSALPALGPPLWLVAGLADRTVPPAQAEEVAARVRGAQIVRLRGLGHLAHEEAPALVARLAEALLADPYATPPPLAAIGG